MDTASGKLAGLTAVVTGGIGQGSTASLADAYQDPIALHNYSGPLLNIVNAHFSAAAPNVAILESGRGLIGQWNRAGMMEQAWAGRICCAVSSVHNWPTDSD